MSNELKVGDKVRITALGMYASRAAAQPNESARRGLVEGNTGTVKTVYGDGLLYNVRTDNAELPHDRAINGIDDPDNGWSFYHFQLEKVES